MKLKRQLVETQVATTKHTALKRICQTLDSYKSLRDPPCKTNSVWSSLQMGKQAVVARRLLAAEFIAGFYR